MMKIKRTVVAPAHVGDRVCSGVVIVGFVLSMSACVRAGFSGRVDGGAASDGRAADLRSGDGAALDGTIGPLGDGEPSPFDGSFEGTSNADAGELSTLGSALGVGGPAQDLAKAVVVDAQGNVIITGAFGDSVDFGGGLLTATGSADIFVASYDPQGSLRWAQRFGGASGASSGTALAVDAAGNVFVTGYVGDAVNFGAGVLAHSGGLDIFAASFTAAGALRWAKSYGGTARDQGAGLGTDSSGNVYLTGLFNETVDFGAGAVPSAGSNDIFLIGFDSDGGRRWSKSFGAGAADLAGALVAGPNGDIVITGYFGGDVDFGSGAALSASGGADGFVAGYSSAGLHRWSRRFGGAEATTDRGIDLALDGAGNVSIAGEFFGTTSFGGGDVTATSEGDVFIASYGPAGAYRWSRTYAGASSALVMSADSMPGGGVIVAGHFSGTVDFGAGPLVSAAERDAFVLSVDSTGALNTALRFGGTFEDEAWGVASDARGGAWITGLFEGGLSFDNVSLSSSGAADVFLLHLGP